jgi:hypothetical protein
MADTPPADPKAQLDAARIAYEKECARGISSNPAERQDDMKRYREARAEYFRLLGEQRR